ncbi:cell division protein ZipA C-terminal FtsZ-binding domain-containing protein [Wohlfahrtiimonas sp. G9077]|uniref:cell division protein ZipA C-terminal FtsZ-binding domain-containing protein n=1 Tax=Wohlfahrtiimonas sp. G9077 TaxID=1980118 RepID=UPI000B99C182|nr:cell division protein ZipA C-terminal FtsZ-binding domain-containing protein [Wohlfahrtiimonas sp. G9077]OYQ72929.1 hypothetical protein B9T20_08300 [Wohlfahrtiimonas sp. G9077]
MSGSIGSLLLLIIAVASGIYWFILKRQNDEEDNDRIEPHIDHHFSEFSQQALPKDDGEETVSEPVQTEVVQVAEMVEAPAPKAPPKTAAVDESTQKPEKSSADRLPEDSEDLDDALDEDDDEQMEEQAPKASFFARIKEMFAGSSNTEDAHDDASQARPEPVGTVALILRAPNDAPYTGYEVLETAKDLKLMVGADGFLQQIVTTYLGDEPMYSIANMIHPGSFNTPDILNTEIPGLLFFASIPGPDPQMDTVERLIHAAAFFGQRIGGTLLDENQQPVDRDYLQNLVAKTRAQEKQIWAKHRSHR